MLLRASNHVAPNWGFQLENFELRVRGDIAQVLRGNEDELPVFHFFGYFDESVERKLSRNRVEKHVELIHHTERCFKALPNGEEQRKSGKAPFTTTQCLNIFGLSTFIRVVLQLGKKQSNVNYE